MYVNFFFLWECASCRYRSPNDNSLHLGSNTRIQIIDSMDFLPQAEKNQCGAFYCKLRCPYYALFLTVKNREMNTSSCYRKHHASQSAAKKMIKHLWRTRSVPPRPISTASIFSSVDQQLGITLSVTPMDGESQSELVSKIHLKLLSQTPLVELQTSTWFFYNHR